MRTGAALLCFFSCVGALQLNELVSSSHSSPEITARALQRRDAPEVSPNKNSSITDTINGTDSSPALTASAAASVNAPSANASSANASTVHVDPVKKIDLSKPGVLKRAVLVFGGFGLVALAYFLFYRRRNINNTGDGMNKPSDGSQFRYGVLQTDERADRMELSRMPLTMESDEDEDEDLEIFDLGQKRKSLSYVNLQTEDRQSAVEDILASNAGSSQDKEQLLLDIEDPNTAAVIPLSSASSSKTKYII